MGAAVTVFTPVSALVGGVLIGLAATLLLALLGRIAGISGIVNGAIDHAGDRSWRFAFLFGLVAGAAAWFYFGSDVPAPRVGFSMPWLIVAGLLVGAGTRLGGGCTSGHGVCGLARLSPRSLAAVVAFIGAGMVAVFVLRHVIGAMP